MFQLIIQISGIILLCIGIILLIIDFHKNYKNKIY